MEEIQTPAESEKRPAHRPQTHGIKKLKQAVKQLGSRAIDKRTSLGRALAQWRGLLIADLGGDSALSTQQKAIVDLCVKDKLMLDSIDAWILTQDSIINKRKKAVIAVVKDRLQLADALARHLDMLGLKRIPHEVKDELEKMLDGK